MTLLSFSTFFVLLLISLLWKDPAFAKQPKKNETFVFNARGSEKSLNSGKIIHLPETNKFFTGRGKEIRDISQILTQNNIVVIQGISGIGKSQLAKKYAHSYRDNYDLIWWFDSDKNMGSQIDSLLQEIALKEKKPYYRPATLDDFIRKLQQELNSLDANYLLIFDNVEDMTSMTPYGPFKDSLKDNDLYRKHVIVTYKKMNNIYPALMIDKFQRTESLAFLSKLLSEEKEEDLNELAKALEDLPLALAQAASYIRANPSITIPTYLELLKEDHSALWKSEEKGIKNSEAFQNDHYNKSMLTTTKMNIDSLRQKSALAYDLLCFCALFHYHHIPLEVLENWACEKQRFSKVEFHEALSLLLNYFLLEKEKNASQETDEKECTSFSQHELIQLISLETINDETKRKILREAAESLLQKLTYSSETLYEQFKEKEHFSNHVEKLCQLAEKWKKDLSWSSLPDNFLSIV